MNRDIFGKDAHELRNKRLFLFDMDGTIYKEDILFEKAWDLLHEITNLGGQYVFVTNNSSKSVRDYIAKIHRMKITAGVDNFFTSTQAAIWYLKHQHNDSLVYCQGTRSFVEELRQAGIRVVETVHDEAEVVLVGFDTELTSEKIRNTCEMLQKDVTYIATNPDLACPVSFGFIPDCGAICGMIKEATKREPVYMGKPNPFIVESTMQKFGFRKEETCVIGDRLYTDIVMGLNAGVTAIAVLTGETTVDEISGSDIRPTYTFRSVREIWETIG